MSNSTPSKILDGHERYLLTMHRAQHQGVVFDLSEAGFLSLSGSTCFYCGIIAPAGGIDRVDVQLGYSKGNVIPIYDGCGAIKSTRSHPEFLIHLIPLVTEAAMAARRISGSIDSMGNAELERAMGITFMAKHLLTLWQRWIRGNEFEILRWRRALGMGNRLAVELCDGRVIVSGAGEPTDD